MGVEFDTLEEKEVRQYISEMTGDPDARGRGSSAGGKLRARSRNSFDRYLNRKQRQRQTAETNRVSEAGRGLGTAAGALVARALPITVTAGVGAAAVAAALIVVNKRLNQVEASFEALTQSRGRLASQKIIDDLGRRIIDEATNTFKSGDARGLWEVMQVTASAGKKELGATMGALYKLFESMLSGNEFERAMSDAGQEYWKNARRIHPVARKTLKIIQGRFEHQQERGDFLGGWKSGGLTGG